jgi:hypothetical protein
MTVYVGGTEVVTATFRDSAGALADPTSVTVTIEDPDGNQAAGVAVNQSVGIYTVDVTCDDAGYWFVRVVGTGNNVDAISETTVCCKGSSFT